MRNKLSLFFVFFLIFPIILLAGFFWWKWAISPVDTSSKEQKIFVIARGENTDQIIKRLEFEGLIKSPLAFKIILRKDNLAGKIQAGDFKLGPQMNAREIADQLLHGTLDSWVTIPEGLRLEEYFKILTDAGFDINYNDWLKATKGKEGYLFPDTYLIPKDASASTVVNLMLDNFEKKTAEIGKKASPEEIVLASLLEREVKLDADRQIVAGILLKRLKNDWPLEVDATIQYALGNVKCQISNIKCNWWQEPTKDDLELESAFNTYKNKGLPPSPICNPGLGAIKAAMFPKTSDYWFYLSDSKGKLHFSKTTEEHDQNIEKYLNK
jgi:UPF0755 protein